MTYNRIIFKPLIIFIFLLNNLIAHENLTNQNFKKEENSLETVITFTEEEREFLIKNKIRCVVSSDWNPFNFKYNNKIVGISIDYWKLIKKKSLIQSICSEVKTYDEATSLIKNKKADLMLSSSISENNLGYGLFSIPYTSYPLAIATATNESFISDMSMLYGKKIAISKSNNSYNLLKSKYPQIDFKLYDNNIKALKALNNEEVYAVIDILPVLSQSISDFGLKSIKISGTTEFNFELRVMIRNDYEKLVPIINKAILAISNGEIQQIKNRWFALKVEKEMSVNYLWEVIAVIIFIIFILFYRQFILYKHNKKLQLANEKIEQKSFELHKKTKELARQKMLFEKIFHESTDGIILLKSKDYSIIDCNQAAFKMLNYDSKEQFISQVIFEFFPQYQPNGFLSKTKYMQMIDTAIQKGSNIFEWVHKTKDGNKLWIEVVITAIAINHENILHIVCRNIDSRKKIEQELNSLTHTLEHRIENEIKKNEQKTKQLVQQSRLAQMGEMISMIAHQWRQPLAAISATANNILIRMMINEDIKKELIEQELSLISDYSQHLSSTIDDFRNFFKSERKIVETTLESIIENSLSIVSNSLISNDISLSKDFNCNKKINISATEINQVILNLIKNAEDALIERKIESAKIEIKTYCDENHVVVEISDNAGGVSENILDKIFDPYFSTKSEKDGTGLGLYMSKIIINDHCQGSLSVKNSTQGAIFILRLPIIPFNHL